MVEQYNPLCGCTPVPWEHVSFTNPFDAERQVYVFADVPHLVKLSRNHFLDSGFLIDNITVNTNPLFDLLGHTNKAEVKIAHKLTLNHLTVKKAGRQKVKLATQLFSNTNVSALEWCGKNGLIKAENWPQCAKLLKIFNDWFDVMNTRRPEPDRWERMKAYGLALNTQLEILDNMIAMITEMRVQGKKVLAPFQTGILISSKSVKLWFNDLEKRYNVKYILTYRLNQDVLENFFSAIRAAGHLHDHPLPTEFACRMRLYILGRNEGVLSHKANTEVDETSKLDVFSELAGQSDPDPDEPESSISSGMLKKILTGTFPNSEDYEVEDKFEDFHSVPTDVEVIGEAGLTYIAGYVAFRMRGDDRTLGAPTGHFDLSREEEQVPARSWINSISEGGLLQPDPEFLKEVQVMEAIFQKFNASEVCDKISINKNPGFVANLSALIAPHVVRASTKAIKIFSRTQVFIRIKDINARCEEEKRQKLARKMKKTVE